MVGKGTKKSKRKKKSSAFLFFFKSHDTAKMHAKHDE